MAIVDLTTTQGSQPPDVSPRMLMWEKIVDFSVNNLASSDTAPIFDLPAEILVIGAKVEVLTAEGGTATIDIGVTGGDVDRYIDGANINAAAGTVVFAGDAGTPEPVSLQNNGVYLSAAETVSILANDALDAAVIRVQIFAIDCRPILNDPA